MTPGPTADPFSPPALARSTLTALVVLCAVFVAMFRFSPSAAAAPGTPASCSVSIAGNDVTVQWSAVAGAATYVVKRTVDDGPSYWRGATSQLSFADSNREATLVYTVTAKDANGDLSAPRTCGAGGGGAVPVASCAVSINGGTVNVSWPASPGADRYVVRRTVDGGSLYWRGTTTGLNFTDSNRDGELVYRVFAKVDPSALSTATVCTAGGGGGVAPTLCSVSIAGAAVTVQWPAAVGAVSYVVKRTVNGGPSYWRGTTTDLVFVDSNRDAALAYTVAAKDANGDLAQAASCANGGGPGPGFGPPSNCTAVDDGSTVTVTWDAGAGAVDYVVRRSRNGGSDRWRGVTTSTTFVDSSRDDLLVYRVESRDADGDRSSRTTCTNRSGVDPFTADAIAVGDLSDCDENHDTDVSLLLDDISGPIFGLGDFVNDGEAAQFSSCFEPDFGRHVSRISPVTGNHEYDVSGATPYFDYFGSVAGDPDEGWYAETHGNWQVLFLNSNCSEVGCDEGDDQYEWVEDQLDAAPAGACRAVMWHHPRWSSAGPAGNNPSLDDLLTLLHDDGLDLVLNGHSHFYERLARVDPDGNLDGARGFRQITVGTGGHRPKSIDPNSVVPFSQKLFSGTFGVLALDLDDDSYGWQFVEKNGAVLDSGSAPCGG